MMQIRFSFLAAAAALIILGHADLFVVLFFSVTLHELAHVLAARRFGARVTGFRLSALGEAAVIRDTENVPACRRVLLLLSGPLANLALGLLAYAVCGLSFVRAHSDASWVGTLRQAAFYNVVLCFFNLLPIFPLDGGRLLQLWLGNWLGILRANRLIIRLGCLAGLLFIVLGGLQAVLFPYNISLICMGVYIRRKNKKINLTLTYEFFQALFAKSVQMEKKGVLPVKMLAVSASYPIQRMVERLGWDHFVCVMLNGENQRLLTEAALSQYILQYGLTGTMEEVYAQMNE